MSEDLRALEDAKAEALAAFAAIATIIDRANEPSGEGRAAGVKSLRDDAVRHLGAALAIINRGKGGEG